MKHLIIALLCFILNANISILSAQTLIPDQSEDYPLYTNLDESYFGSTHSQYSYHGDEQKLLEERKSWLPYVKQDDALALFLYGKSFYYDKSPCQHLMSKDTAAYYFKKSAELNYSQANYILMEYHIKLKNYDLALFYLNQYLQYSDNYGKVSAYYLLAKMYDPNAVDKYNPIRIFPTIENKIDSALYFYELAVKKTKDLDELYVAHMSLSENVGRAYIENGLYEKAMEFFLLEKTDDDEGFKIALEYLKTHPNLSLDDEARKKAILVLKKSINTLHSWYLEWKKAEFNELYFCRNLITKEELGDIIIKNMDCEAGSFSGDRISMANSENLLKGIYSWGKIKKEVNLFMEDLKNYDWEKMPKHFFDTDQHFQIIWPIDFKYGLGYKQNPEPLTFQSLQQILQTSSDTKSKFSAEYKDIKELKDYTKIRNIYCVDTEYNRQDEHSITTSFWRITVAILTEDGNRYAAKFLCGIDKRETVFNKKDRAFIFDTIENPPFSSKEDVNETYSQRVLSSFNNSLMVECVNDFTKDLVGGNWKKIEPHFDVEYYENSKKFLTEWSKKEMNEEELQVDFLNYAISHVMNGHEFYGTKKIKEFSKLKDWKNIEAAYVIRLTPIGNPYKNGYWRVLTVFVDKKGKRYLGNIFCIFKEYEPKGYIIGVSG